MSEPRALAIGIVTCVGLIMLISSAPHVAVLLLTASALGLVVSLVRWWMR